MTYNAITEPTEVDVILDVTLTEELTTDKEFRDIDPNYNRPVLYHREAIKLALASHGYVIQFMGEPQPYTLVSRATGKPLNP